jgi:hypothetical protein
MAYWIIEFQRNAPPGISKTALREHYGHRRVIVTAPDRPAAEDLARRYMTAQVGHEALGTVNSVEEHAA